MRMFGFTISGVQIIHVICPKCGESARMLFQPSKRDIPVPLLGMKEAESLVTEVTTLPSADDVHFFCFKCLIILKNCEVTMRPCLITEAAVAAELRQHAKSIEKLAKPTGAGDR